MRMLHRAALACLTALFLAASVSPGVAQEEILDWHSDIEVHEDGSMTVTETIRVRAEGNQIKRGIYRDFPTKYKDRAGNRVTVDFSLLGVERDGRPEPHHTKDLSNGVRIYAGSSNVFLDPGEYRYRITYRTDRQLGYFDEHDELYWNVTGNGWAFPIRQASAAVTLPPTVPAQSLRMTGYTGPQGSREQALTWETDSSGRTVYRSSRPLAPKEGLTIVLGWEKGHIAEPGRAERTVFWITDNMTSAAAVAGLVLLLLYYLWAWRRAGKDPEKGTVIPPLRTSRQPLTGCHALHHGDGFRQPGLRSSGDHPRRKRQPDHNGRTQGFRQKRVHPAQKGGGAEGSPVKRGAEDP